MWFWCRFNSSAQSAHSSFENIFVRQFEEGALSPKAIRSSKFRSEPAARGGKPCYHWLLCSELRFSLFIQHFMQLKMFERQAPNPFSKQSAMGKLFYLPLG